jgi:predicted MPP superfamily phosphohydrolase
LLAGALGFYATTAATRWLRITRLRVGLPALPDEWVGVRIALLTDFHLGGKAVSAGLLHRAKQAALDFQPDLIALGGDFFDEGRHLKSGDLFSRWPDGTPVVAVLGNHDYRGGTERLPDLIAQLKNAGVILLRNRAVALDIRGRQAWVAGVDDPHTGRDDVERALEDVPLDEPALLLLAHSPSAAVDLPVAGARLLLAGHTHGGQIRLLPSGRIPFVRQIRRLRGLRPLPPLPFVRGRHWSRGTVIIISDGLGQSTVGARLRTRPEVVLIKLAEAPLDGPPCDDARRYVTYQGDEPRLLRWLT